MPNSNVLAGDTVVLTGTSVTASIVSYIESFGATAIHLPLIEVVERTSEDTQYFIQSMDADWLIFTSQNAVRFLKEKMIRYGYSAEHFNGRIAAVGSKTKQSLEQLGFSIDFVPTTYSADVFIEQFQVEEDATCVFFRGNLAKSTIPNGINCDVQCYTVYDTVQTARHMPKLNELLTARVTIIFASPSAVDVFETYKKEATYHVAAIGHITRDALIAYGEQNITMPETYTMRSVIDALAKQKGTK